MSKEFSFEPGRCFRLKTILVAFMAGLSMVGCQGQGKTRFDSSSPGTQVAPINAASVAGYQSSYADVVTHVSPSAVTVRSTERARPAQQFPFSDDPFFRQFFGDRQPQQQPQPRVQGL